MDRQERFVLLAFFFEQQQLWTTRLSPRLIHSYHAEDMRKPHRSQSEPRLTQERPELFKSIRHAVTFTARRFDVTTLPTDLQRVYHHLSKDYGESYALTVCFVVRTAVEMHRAWHMTLLTSKLLQQIKDKFGLRVTWNLGVIHLVFCVDDGRFELHRKVPYDYDSEFQDLYMKIAVALIEGHINIHEALIFEQEARRGKHTAKSGLFLRSNPGRLVLYPLEAATCTVIFFGGNWKDAGVAAITGITTGCVQYLISWMSQKQVPELGVLVDVLVGMTTGVITGFFQNHGNYCLSAIFLGTLYWFFYGTAFVIGLLEIISGELETGVTRFIAVSVKTFVLSLGTAVGLQISLGGNVYDAWTTSNEQCGSIDLDTKWWRIPLYLLCSASALGQYRFPVANYWRGLIVQLVGYEVQYKMLQFFAQRHARDFLDTASSNIAAAMAAVATASLLSYLVDQIGYYYHARLLQRRVQNTAFGDLVYKVWAAYVRLVNWFGLGRKTALRALQMEKELQLAARELRDPNHPRVDIKLSPEDEAALVEAIVDAGNLNIWSLLMPAVYQLVPGSLIARLWFNAVFPPPPVEISRSVGDVVYIDRAPNPESDDVFYGLMVISTSLALGLLLGFAFVSAAGRVFSTFTSMISKHEVTPEEQESEEARIERLRFRQQGVLNLVTEFDDPDGDMTNVPEDHGVLIETRTDDLGLLTVKDDAEVGMRFRSIHSGKE